MGYGRVMSGTVAVKLVSADPAGTLFELNRAGIILVGLRYEDDLTVHFRVRSSEQKRVVQIIQKHGDRIDVLEDGSVLGAIKGLVKRPVLIFGAVLILMLTFYVPSKILFVTVDGNSGITSQQIITAAQKHGIYFGASRHRIRSEKVKNALLAEIPQLQWVGVNTKGCVAYISVRERVHSEAKTGAVGISSIVAQRDGVIRELTVLSGNPVCKVGQAVKAGQLLVSGYSDCGICIHGTTASADILADTQRNLSLVTPVKGHTRASSDAPERKYSLILGKKRINFYKYSGIYDTSCGKMYVEYYLSLPGGFRLPVGLAVETVTGGELVEYDADEEQTLALLKDYAGQYLSQQMIAGTVNGSSVCPEPADGVLRLKGTYLCSEMIGKTRNEETIDQYGETN